MRWSSNLIPSNSPASRSRVVGVRSSGLVFRSPGGWLWTPMIAQALRRMGGLKTSGGFTIASVSVPIETIFRTPIPC